MFVNIFVCYNIGVLLRKALVNSKHENSINDRTKSYRMKMEVVVLPTVEHGGVYALSRGRAYNKASKLKA